MGGGPLVFVDFETRSRVDLKAAGGRAYVRDESTSLLCGAALVVEEGWSPCIYVWSPLKGIGRKPVPPPAKIPKLAGLEREYTWGSDDPHPDVFDAAKRGTVVAHNWHGFDGPLWRDLGYPEPLRCADSLDRARRASLPGGLDKIGTRLYGTGKDKTGHSLMLRYCKPTAAKGNQVAGAFADPAPPALDAIARYCAKDVLLMACMWIQQGLGDPHPDDAVLEAHETIDARGIPIDGSYVSRLTAAEQALTAAAVATAASHGVEETLLRSSSVEKGFPSWLKERGFPVEDVQGSTMERLLATVRARVALGESDLAPVAEVIEARMIVCRVLGGKLASLRARTCPDGRLRGSLAYYGAHTGRWSGRGPQPQNFPRAPEDADTLRPEDVRDPKQLGGLLRGVVRSPAGSLLVTADASQIEARVLLWLAGDTEALRIYEEGGDAYRALAAIIFRCGPSEVTKAQRNIAKVVQLATGFGGGRETVAGFAAKAGVDLAAAGVTAAGLVDTWRDSNTLVAGERTGGMAIPDDEDDPENAEPIYFRSGGLWKDIYAAAFSTVRDGQPRETCRGLLGYQQREGDLYIRLPSGRELRYRDALIEKLPCKFTGKPKDTLTFAHARFGRTSTYGGRLTENLTQATARDVLAGALVRLEAAGWPVVLHVHDEVVVEVPVSRAATALSDVIQIASDPPPWAAGLPIKFEGDIGERWSK